MNSKLLIAVLGLLAALVALATKLWPTASQPEHRQTQSGSANIQIGGNNNTVNLPPAPQRAPSIQKYKGALKATDKPRGDPESTRLARAFIKFASSNEGKIVELDVHGFYTDEEWHNAKQLGTRMHGGFPDPRHFVLADCEGDACNYYDYEIVGTIGEFDSNVASTARYIRGHFRVRTTDARQGTVFVTLKPVSPEHIEVLEK